MNNKEFKKEARRIAEEWREGYNARMAMIEKQRKITKDADYYGAIQRKEAEDEITRLKREIGAEKRITLAALSKVYDDYAEDVLYSVSVNGDDLTADARLLNMDAVLTVGDLRAIKRRNAGNFTMEKLVHNYAENRGYIDIAKNLNVDLICRNAAIAGEQAKFVESMGASLKYVFKDVDPEGDENRLNAVYDAAFGEHLDEVLPD